MMIKFAMVRHEENTLNQLSDGVIRNTMKPFLKTAAEIASKGMLSSIYGSMEDIVK